MDWERLLINFGVVMGFLTIMAFWIGLAMWLRVDADKRGIVGWVWAFVGLLTGPLGLIGYILWRGNRPVLEVVNHRDALIAANSRAHAPVDYNPDAPASAPIPPSPVVPLTVQTSEPADNLKAALEAEQRGYQQNG